MNEQRSRLAITFSAIWLERPNSTRKSKFPKRRRPGNSDCQFKSHHRSAGLSVRRHLRVELSRGEQAWDVNEFQGSGFARCMDEAGIVKANDMPRGGLRYRVLSTRVRNTEAPCLAGEICGVADLRSRASRHSVPQRSMGTRNSGGRLLSHFYFSDTTLLKNINLKKMLAAERIRRRRMEGCGSIQTRQGQRGGWRIELGV